MSDLDESMGEADLVEGLEKKKFSGKKLILFGGAGVGVLIIAGVAFMLLSGGEEKQKDELDVLAEDVAADNAARAAEEAKTPEATQLLFIEVKPGLINLKTDGQGSSFINAEFTLEVDRESQKVSVESQMPRILNEFQTFLREMRPSDLEGAQGIHHVQQEMLRRINQTVAPARVNAVLVQNFVISGNPAG